MDPYYSLFMCIGYTQLRITNAQSNEYFDTCFSIIYLYLLISLIYYSPNLYITYVLLLTASAR